jgi:hypothetical protein
MPDPDERADAPEARGNQAMTTPNARPFRVTDPDEDAPDGTVMTFVRTRGSWEPVLASNVNDGLLREAVTALSWIDSMYGPPRGDGTDDEPPWPVEHRRRWDHAIETIRAAFEDCPSVYCGRFRRLAGLGDTSKEY